VTKDEVFIKEWDQVGSRIYHSTGSLLVIIEKPIGINHHVNVEFGVDILNWLKPSSDWLLPSSREDSGLGDLPFRVVMVG
jgi:hypothetical protein